MLIFNILDLFHNFEVQRYNKKGKLSHISDAKYGYVM